MLYSVYHKNKSDFLSNDVLDWDKEKGRFTLVAVVSADSLDEVFYFTNHVDQDWTTWENVNMHVEGRVRSTSVGDVVVDNDGQPWLCAQAGWTKLIGKEEMELLTPDHPAYQGYNPYDTEMPGDEEFLNG